MNQLWELAEGLSVTKVRISDLEGFDEVGWFGGPLNIKPTRRAIAEHAQDIVAADLSYPITLSPSGEVLYGCTASARHLPKGWGQRRLVRLP